MADGYWLMIIWLLGYWVTINAPPYKVPEEQPNMDQWDLAL